ncbi:MAG: dihydrofolate reductase family protein [Candidatus Limnocylindria bacterium]
MRKLSVQTFLTLDGVMQGPGGPGEDDSGGFTHGGWSVKYWDDQMGQVMTESMSRAFDMLLGRRTYEIFAAHWPRVTDDPTADVLNGAKKHVASTTLDKVEWQNSTLLKGDVGQAVGKLKEESGPDIQVHGSGNLIQTLMQHDLVDEYSLWTFPVLLGSGKRLFAKGTMPGGLKVIETRTSSTGVIMTRYERAGDIAYGTFRLE